MALAKELLDRLICAKYIFLKGIEVLDRGGPFSPGLAVLHFQDSAEMFLRVIAEELHCPLKETTPFNQIIDLIDRVDDRKLTHRSALNQLNKARTNFKHFGLEPKIEDASKFRHDLEAFFPSALQIFLNLDFDSISLTSLIGHRRTENHLNKAERLITEEDYEGSINASAAAFSMYRSYIGRGERYAGLIRRSHRFRDRNLDDLLKEVEDIKRVLREQQSQLNLIMYGFNLGDYRRFQRIAPSVKLTNAGTTNITRWGEYYANRDDALFCYRFVIDAILLMRQNKLPAELPDDPTERKFRVAKICDIIVWPCDDPEVIRLAEVGEVLFGNPGNRDKNGYFAIIQDDETAYVKKEALAPVDIDKDS